MTYYIYIIYEIYVKYFNVKADISQSQNNFF